MYEYVYKITKEAKEWLGEGDIYNAAEGRVKTAERSHRRYVDKGVNK